MSSIGSALYRNFPRRIWTTLGVSFFLLTPFNLHISEVVSFDDKTLVEIQSQDLKGINPELLLTVAILETGHGHGKVYETNHNLFSIKIANESHCHNVGCYRLYRDDFESIRDVVRLLSSRTRYKEAYQFAVANKSEEFFRALQKAGYSTSQKYASRLSRVLKTFKRSKVS